MFKSFQKSRKTFPNTINNARVSIISHHDPPRVRASRFGSNYLRVVKRSPNMMRSSGEVLKKIDWANEVC